MIVTIKVEASEESDRSEFGKNNNDKNDKTTNSKQVNISGWAPKVKNSKLLM